MINLLAVNSPETWYDTAIMFGIAFLFLTTAAIVFARMAVKYDIKLSLTITKRTVDDSDENDINS